MSSKAITIYTPAGTEPHIAAGSTLDMRWGQYTTTVGYYIDVNLYANVGFAELKPAKAASEQRRIGVLKTNCSCFYNAIDDNFTHYPPVPGYADLLKAISQKFKRDNGLDYTPQQIVVSTGGKQSIYQAVMALVNPGDEVIIPTPYWVSYRAIAQMAEANIIYIPGKIENDFKITAAQLEAAITPKTKLLMFSSSRLPSTPA